MRNYDHNNDRRNRRRWTPPRWVVHIALAWFIIGSVIGLLLETVTGPWWRVAYEALAGGDSLGLIVYVNGGAYLLAEELDMIISRLNRLKDQDQFRAEGEAEGRQQGRAEGRQQGREEGQAEGRQQGREEGQAEGLRQGRQEGQAEGLQQGRQEGQAEVESEIESVRQTLTPEQLDSLPPAVRDLLQRPSGRNNGNGSYRR